MNLDNFKIEPGMPWIERHMALRFEELAEYLTRNMRSGEHVADILRALLEVRNAALPHSTGTAMTREGRKPPLPTCLRCQSPLVYRHLYKPDFVCGDCQFTWPDVERTPFQCYYD